MDRENAKNHVAMMSEYHHGGFPVIVGEGKTSAGYSAKAARTGNGS